jgi:hypothetical protein
VGLITGGLAGMVALLLFYGAVCGVAGGVLVYLVRRRHRPPDPRLILAAPTVQALKALKDNHAGEFVELLAAESARERAQTPPVMPEGR